MTVTLSLQSEISTPTIDLLEGSARPRSGNRVMPSPFREPLKPLHDTSLPVADLDVLAKSWLRESERANRVTTYDTKVDILNRFLWFLKFHKGYEVCDADEIEAYLNHVKNGHLEPCGRWGVATNRKPVKDLYVRGHYNVVKGLFSYIVRKGYLYASPVARVLPPKNHTDCFQLFSTDDVNGFLDACRHSWHPRRNTALIYILFDCGLRAAELCALNYGDLRKDGADRFIKVLDGKGGKQREVPIGTDAYFALTNYLQERGATNKKNPLSHSSPMFLLDRGATAGDRITKRSLQHTINELGRIAGVTGVRCSPHTFRHTFATNYLLNGGDMRRLKDLLGHSTLNTVLIYSHMAERDLAAQHRIASPGDNLNRRVARERTVTFERELGSIRSRKREGA